jgi:hypothetical protein
MRRSSTRALPEPVFFTDRDLGPSVAELLRAGGLLVEAYHEHFRPDNVPDEEWLQFVGERGWVALTHNKRIRYEPDELDSLMTHGVKAFFVIGKGPHPALAAAILQNIHRIKRLLRKHREPFAAKVYQSEGGVELWITHRQWLEGRRSGRR